MTTERERERDRDREICLNLSTIPLLCWKTGLDPLSRRKVWEAIKEMKKDRIVVLTTHSMEEADYLSDHVFIMHTGNMKASGSSSFLKKNYGKVSKKEYCIFFCKHGLLKTTSTMMT